MAQVLVTGASGFIGSLLAETLAARGEQVTCLVRTTSNVERLQNKGLSLVYGDVTDPKSLSAAVAGKEVVYHLAGCNRALRVQTLYRVNEDGMRNVARACAEQPQPPVLLVTSSLAAAGPAVDGRPRTEADPAAPVSNYGRSKLAGERVAAEFADRVPITVVRPPMVFGDGDRATLEIFRAIWLFRTHLVSGWRASTYSLIYVADLVELLILAAERGARIGPAADVGNPPAKGYYFADCGERPTYGELGRMVARALSRRVLVLPMPLPMVWGLACATESVNRIIGRAPYISFDKLREVSAGSWICSARAAVDELGFTIGAPMHQRLEQTAAWYRREGWL